MHGFCENTGEILRVALELGSWFGLAKKRIWTYACPSYYAFFFVSPRVCVGVAEGKSRCLCFFLRGCLSWARFFSLGDILPGRALCRRLTERQKVLERERFRDERPVERGSSRALVLLVVALMMLMMLLMVVYVVLLVVSVLVPMLVFVVLAVGGIVLDIVLKVSLLSIYRRFYISTIGPVFPSHPLVSPCSLSRC